MGQNAEANGNFAFDDEVGDLAVTHFYPEHSRGPLVAGRADGRGQDRQLRPDLRLRPPQARRRRRVRLQRLLVLVRHAVRLRRVLRTTTTANLINPSQYIQGKDRYKKDSHELRLASPQREPLALRRRPVLAEPEARHRAALQDRRPRPTQYSITGWPDTHLADQAGARGPRRGGVRRAVASTSPTS